ncbi:hypothetical protein [Paraburkholderia sp. HD33-4]|uniref:hypothetical protein n=1 Tax=Paraburkholderia sp. HD33-4 TaxID=2883242 RepID=UPI001F2D970B|nr:hypothetical protein [Paraburkholderia sp. HD33-4]
MPDLRALDDLPQGRERIFETVRSGPRRFDYTCDRNASRRFASSGGDESVRHCRVATQAVAEILDKGYQQESGYSLTYPELQQLAFRIR